MTKHHDDDPNQTSPSDQGKKSDPRRSLLKTLAVGGVAGAALPTQWSKPMIDSVVLPAHAQTTSGTVTGGGGGGGAGPGPAPSRSTGEALMDFFVNPASAGEPDVEDYCLELSISVNGGTITSVTVTKMCFDACKSGTRWFDQNISSTPLSGSGSNWMGMVAGLQLVLSNVNAAGPKLADSNYDGVPGEIFAGDSCDCSCDVD